MPRLTRALPRYRRHTSGQAIVEFGGQIHYLGPYKSPESRHAYDQLIARWLANGRQLGGKVADPTAPSPRMSDQPVSPPPQPALVPAAAGCSVVELAARFWEFAKKHYVKHGSQTGTHLNYRLCLKLLKELDALPVDKFGPRLLKQLRQKMIDAGHSRRYINDNLSRIRHVFRWAVSEEIVPVSVVQALETVEGVRIGAGGVAERPPVAAASDSVVEATLHQLPQVVADMARLARLTGARPGEICVLRPCDVDTSVTPWVYLPQTHKTEHHGKERIICIGPRGQEILRPYLERRTQDYCFSPAESKSRRRSRPRQASTSRQATPKAATGRRRPGPRYTNASFRRAITRACDLAFPSPAGLSAVERSAWRRQHRWTPNMLRHAAATEICMHFPLLAAKTTLGHATVRTTENYVHPDLELAKKVMSSLG